MNHVATVVRIDLLIYSVILSAILYGYLKINRKNENYSTVLFKRILVSIVLVSIAEIISWSTEEIGNSAQISIHYWSNAVFLASIGFTSAFGLNYLDYKVFGNIERSKRSLWIYLIPTYVNIGFAVYNHFSRGFLFTIASTNQYYRGIGVTISSVILYVFATAVVFYFHRDKSLITGRITQAISVFVFVPVVGSILQVLSYGTTFGMPSYTLGCFLTFLLVEKDEMAKDPLTQLYTRTNLENRLRYKLKSSDAFTVMMIDLNDFKVINDTYGHLEGDRVLQKVSEILKRHVNREDMVCRYGGDEFFILIENSSDIGSCLIEAIDKSIESYNKGNYHEYAIELSYGYEFVDNDRDVELEALIHRIDRKMYEDKMKRKNYA